MGARPRTEDFEDEPGPVDDLGLPLALEVALLNRRQCAVDDDQPDLLLGDRLAEGLYSALPDQGAGRRPAEANDLAGDDVEIDRPREPDRLVEPRVERANGAIALFAAGREF